LARLRTPLKLATEMAAHEEMERAALAGELADLHERWKEAEEIAAVADTLTLSPAVLERLDRLRLRL
jgi:predicted nuclease with TOPRIM domain